MQRCNAPLAAASPHSPNEGVAGPSFDTLHAGELLPLWTHLPGRNRLVIADRCENIPISVSSRQRAPAACRRFCVHHTQLTVSCRSQSTSICSPPTKDLLSPTDRLVPPPFRGRTGLDGESGRPHHPRMYRVGGASPLSVRRFLHHMTVGASPSVSSVIVPQAKARYA